MYRHIESSFHKLLRYFPMKAATKMESVIYSIWTSQTSLGLTFPIKLGIRLTYRILALFKLHIISEFRDSFYQQDNEYNWSSTTFIHPDVYGNITG
ncbi:unnamed protein product [Caretta caretta]